MEATSAFTIDPARQCRAMGHLLKKTHPGSSFYDEVGNANIRTCSRCGESVDITGKPVGK